MVLYIGIFFPAMEIDQWSEIQLEKHSSRSKSLGVVECNTHKQDIWAPQLRSKINVHESSLIIIEHHKAILIYITWKASI